MSHTPVRSIDHNTRGNRRNIMSTCNHYKYIITLSSCPSVLIPGDPQLECRHHRSPKHDCHRQIWSLCAEPSLVTRICDCKPNRCVQKRRWSPWSSWTCSFQVLQSCNPTEIRDESCANLRLGPLSKPPRSPLERCIWKICKILFDHEEGSSIGRSNIIWSILWRRRIHIECKFHQTRNLIAKGRVLSSETKNHTNI